MQAVMSKFLKTTIKVARITVIVLICAVLIAMAVIMITGAKLYVVLDPSMEDYPIGSLIYVEETDVDSLKVGDVITFKLSGETVATHRIIETILHYETNDWVYATKGDLSEESDPELITKDNVIGVPTVVIPKIGNVITYIKYPPGSYITAGIAVVMAVFVFFSDNIIAFIDKKSTKKH